MKTKMDTDSVLSYKSTKYLFKLKEFRIHSMKKNMKIEKCKTEENMNDWSLISPSLR